MKTILALPLLLFFALSAFAQVDPAFQSCQAPGTAEIKNLFRVAPPDVKAAAFIAQMLEVREDKKKLGLTDAQVELIDALTPYITPNLYFEKTDPNHKTLPEDLVDRIKTSFPDWRRNVLTTLGTRSRAFLNGWADAQIKQQDSRLAMFVPVSTATPYFLSGKTDDVDKIKQIRAGMYLPLCECAYDWGCLTSSSCFECVQGGTGNDCVSTGSGCGPFWLWNCQGMCRISPRVKSC